MDRTKKCKKLKNFFSIIHIIFMFGPLCFFIPYGYITGETVEKIAMSFTIILSVILLAISLIVSVSARAGLQRSIMWTLLSGCLFCLKEIQVFIWIMAISSIIDELIILRIKDYYRNAYITNKEIDKRYG